MGEQRNSRQTHDRVIRVFVSSTFRDMRAEREQLVKFVFPELRKLCERRGVAFTDVDLRWGITEEQSQQGRTLPICLAEIVRCRPFFLGMLGERYGWVPAEIPAEMLESERWLEEHPRKSVTELEILHGVLNDPAMADRACFYFRDPAYLATVPPEQHADFEAESEDARDKLADLKDRIRRSGLPVRENYPDAESLGQWVLRDLTAAIEQRFPIEDVPDPLDRDAAEHEAFARSRCGVYIGRPEYFPQLDAHAAGDGPPLVLLGESGGGKSALLANWVSRHRQAHPDELVLMHFIGASAYSSDWAAMLRRILGEFKRHFQIDLQIPDKPDALRALFANALHMAAARGRVVLVLDALNQLEDRDGALDLVWLPPVIPANVRLIVSTLPGPTLKDLQTRSWPTLQVQPLQPAERQQFIVDFLAQYRKTLATDLAARVAAAPQTANPLFLRALLEELRLYGDHFTVGQRIEHYLRAETVPDLYRRILVRWEEDYEGDSDLVGDAMSVLWASRRGLSEAELLDLLGSGAEPLPRAAWSPLFLAAGDSLVSRSGFLGFFHDYLREAVRETYIPTEKHQRTTHLRLAEYFRSRELNARMIDELPWHLAQAQHWQSLYALLADAGFFEAAFEAHQEEVKAYWAALEQNSPLRMVDAYRAMLREPGALSPPFVNSVGILLRDAGYTQEALSLATRLVEHFRATGDAESLSTCLENRALILKRGGSLDEAMALHHEAERIRREMGNNDALAKTLGNQATILSSRGELDRALALHKEEERIFRELGNQEGLSISLSNQASILLSRGELDGAMALFKEAERICQVLGNRAGLSTSYGGQANVLFNRGDPDGAMALHKKAEQIFRELGNKVGLAVGLVNQANIQSSRGSLDEATELHKEVERISQESGDKRARSAALGGQALTLRARGDLDGAMALHKEEERICRELGDKIGLSSSLSHQADVLCDRRDPDGMIALLREAESIYREMRDFDRLANCLACQASLLSHILGRHREALLLVQEAYRIAETHGLTDSIQQIGPLMDDVKSKLGER